MADSEQREGMHYLESFPRRWVTVYIPLLLFLFFLLFPFYWMGLTAFKPNAELLSTEGNPFWVLEPTLQHFRKLFIDTSYPSWMWNTIIISVVSTFLSLAASVFAAYAIERLRFKGSHGFAQGCARNAQILCQQRLRGQTFARRGICN